MNGTETALTAEVVVVGAGPAGSTCAGLLARRGYDVVLIQDAVHRPAWPELMAPQAILFWARVDSSRAVISSCGRPCRGILDTWERDLPEYRDFQLTHCSLGQVVERGQFGTNLQEWAVHQGVRKLVQATHVKILSTPTDPFVELQLSRPGGRLRAQLLVDATGQSSSLLPPAASYRLRYDRLIAIHIPVTRPEGPSESMLFASASAGWWYVVDLQNEFSDAVFMTDGDLIPKRLPDLIDHLRTQFHEAFATDPEFESRADLSNVLKIRDARTSCRRQLWNRRWLPIGDAAFSLDPISGNGLLRCLEMADSVVAAVVEFLGTGSFAAFESFATSNAMTFGRALDSLRKIYSQQGNGDRVSNHPFWQRRRMDGAFKHPI